MSLQGGRRYSVRGIYVGDQVPTLLHKGRSQLGITDPCLTKDLEEVCPFCLSSQFWKFLFGATLRSTQTTHPHRRRNAGLAILHGVGVGRFLGVGFGFFVGGLGLAFLLGVGVGLPSPSFLGSVFAFLLGVGVGLLQEGRPTSTATRNANLEPKREGEGKPTGTPRRRAYPTSRRWEIPNSSKDEEERATPTTRRKKGLAFLLGLRLAFLLGAGVATLQ